MPRGYLHISLPERRLIATLREARVSLREIARRTGRHYSTICRELCRNAHRSDEIDLIGYYLVTAQGRADQRRRLQARLSRDPDLAHVVRDGLNRLWSPEQISGRLRRDGVFLSHETIYRWIYSHPMRDEALWSRLRRYHRRSRGPRIPFERSIASRPENVSARAIPGHREADLMIFNAEINQQRNLMTLVERTTRFVRISRHESRISAGITGSLLHTMAALPQALRQSLTFDRGSEFLHYKPLVARGGMDVWFCDPRSPWQKGSVENMNGRLRKLLPSRTDLASLTHRDLAGIECLMNATPRKCLGYLTPAEAMDRLIKGCSPGGALQPEPARRIKMSHFGRIEMSSLPFLALAYRRHGCAVREAGHGTGVDGRSRPAPGWCAVRGAVREPHDRVGGGPPSGFDDAPDASPAGAPS
ncbi:IS30 family transposase [Acetobacter sp. DsW_063]|uniref:IS30 family transposase n=1 Tax=Acetobacter sp. DsW_063 TaxID=1514894 RepID=UPI000A39FDDA|nr:IS30 family transposase [Acetobacter sp. DsW_063]